MKRFLYLAAGVSLFTTAMALSTFDKVFHEKYSIKKDSNLDKLDCAVCHARPKGGKLNTYGKDVQAALAEAKSKKLTPAILAKIEGLDSNKNGKSNLEDIKADVNPGS